jgi:hypothetical protein
MTQRTRGFLVVTVSFGLAAHGQVPEWADVLQDLERLQYVEVEQEGKRFRLRTQAQGTSTRVFRAAGVALPPTVQQLP